MKIIQGKTNSGKTNELLKRFLEDEKASVFITDQLSFDEVVEKTKYLKTKYDICVSGHNDKNVICFSGVVETSMEWLNMVYRYSNYDSIYMEGHMSSYIMKPEFLKTLYNIEEVYNVSITSTCQLNANCPFENLIVVDWKKIR